MDFRGLLLIAAAGVLCGGALTAARQANAEDARATPGAGGAEHRFLHPERSVLGPFWANHSCNAATYAGPETQLYSDRPYHTRETIPVLEGLRFCRAGRHGREVWILDVARDTTLYAIGSAKFELHEAGWHALAGPVDVPAAGISFDTLYAKRVGRGRYVIHYGHAATGLPVFWRPGDARIVPLPPGEGG